MTVATGPQPADFDAWNTAKKRIHLAARSPKFKDGEIWWCHVGVNIGVETYGKGSGCTRPVVILRKVSRHGGLVVPITSRPHHQSMYHEFDWGAGPRWAMLHETRSASVYRFQRRVAEISPTEFQALREAFRLWMGL